MIPVTARAGWRDVDVGNDQFRISYICLFGKLFQVGIGLRNKLAVVIGYIMRKGDLFVLSWARVRQVRRGSISADLLMCSGGVRSIMLLPLVARCLVGLNPRLPNASLAY